MKEPKKRRMAWEFEIAVAISLILGIISSVMAALWWVPVRVVTPGPTAPSISDVLLASPDVDLLTSRATATHNTTQVLVDAFNEVDRQFQESLRSNIAFNAPKSMKLDETVTIELLLNPSLSQNELADQLVQRSSLLTSTAEPGQLLTEGGSDVDVVTNEVIITDRMKAVLIMQKPGTFEIQELHDSAEQPVSSVDTTKWRWSVTAKQQGRYTLELVIYRLIKYADQDYWREVETYKANITVRVSALQWLNSLDWKWIIGILATALLIPLFFRWYDNNKKSTDEQKESKPAKKKLARK